MGDQEETIHPLATRPVKQRPVLLTALCLFSFIYFALISGFSFACILYSDTINRLRDLYLPGHLYSKSHLLVFFFSAFFLHIAAIIGTLLIWSGRKTGYYILLFSCSVIALCQIFQPQAAVVPTGTYFFLIVIFALFFWRLR